MSIEEMRRKPEQWRMTVPKSVVDGSQAQAMYCIADAKADIATLLEENEHMRGALEKISCPSQSEDLLWWQKAARAALEEHKP